MGEKFFLVFLFKQLEGLRAVNYSIHSNSTQFNNLSFDPFAPHVVPMKCFTENKINFNL